MIRSSQTVDSLTVRVLYGIVWNGMAWHGMVWYGAELYCILLYIPRVCNTTLSLQLVRQDCRLIDVDKLQPSLFSPSRAWPTILCDGLIGWVA